MRTLVLWAIVIDLAVSAIAAIVRGANRSTRTYGASDAIGAAIELPLIIWGIVWLATS